MLNDNNNETTNTVKKFFFAVAVKTGGLLESYEDLETTRELFEEDIAEMYGGAAHVIEFREATEEEIEQLPVVLELAGETDSIDEPVPTLLN